MAIQLTKQQQQYVGAGAIGALLLIGAYVKFFWLPISAAKAEARQKIVEIEAKIDKAKKQAARLDRLKDELNVLNEQAVQAEARLPRSKSVPDMLVTLSSVAQKQRVTILTFAPGPVKPQQYFMELNYPITIRGSYHNVGRFLAALALEQRIFNVQNVTYPAPDGAGEMTVSFMLLSYQYKG
ncbi:MAG: type 4a pilus biogenesis protein PilO [Elusimicrobiota bacterium]|nr:type 4a pilus biogenesis protein PilO [Elusimicrobiota bacterium]